MNRFSLTILNGIALAAIVPASTVFAQCNGYSVDVIAGPPCRIFDSFAVARGISPEGTLCGGYLECSQLGHNVIWSPSGEIIAEIPPSSEPGFPNTPFEVNTSGQAVGQLFVPDLKPSAQRAYLYANGQTINLGALPGHNWSIALAINASGTVVGNSNNTAVGPLKAFVWQSGRMNALSLPFDYFSSGYFRQWFDLRMDGHQSAYRAKWR